MTAEQLLNIQQQRMRGVRNTLQGIRKYTITKEFPRDYVVFDLCTTGLRPGADGIIQIGAIKYKDDQQVETFQTLINPRRYIPMEVTKQTDITNQLVEEAPFIEDEIDAFLAFINGLPLVTYNASLHMKFLYALEHTESIQLPPFTIVDVARIARKALSTISDQNLVSLTTYLQFVHTPEDVLSTCKSVNHIYQLSAQAL